MIKLLIPVLIALALISAKATPSIELTTPDPHLGGYVHFAVNDLPSGIKTECNYSGGRCARIQVVCTQGGDVVYGEAGPAEYGFILGGGASQWLTNGGEADCVATLYYWNNHPSQTFIWLAETMFRAGK